MNPKTFNESEINSVVEDIIKTIPIESLKNSINEIGDILPSNLDITYKESELGMLITLEGIGENLFISYKEIEIYVRDTVSIIEQLDVPYLKETVEDILREDIVRWIVGTKENVFTQRV